MPAIMKVRLLRSLGNARRSPSGLRPKYCSMRHLLSIAREPCAITWNLSIMPAQHRSRSGVRKYPRRHAAARSRILLVPRAG